MAKRRIRVVTARDQEQITAPAPAIATKRVIVSSENPRVSTKLTENEIKARRHKYVTSSTMGRYHTAGDTLDSGTAQFYSPQLSTDFLEKPQNLRERRAFYRFFYNTNEIIGRAIDIHSTLPLSKLRLVPPKGKNKHQNEYVYKFFTDMCDNMKLFKTLIEMSHEYLLFGNCVARFAEIKTSQGYKKAQDIQINDLLLTNKGRYRKVLKKYSQPIEYIINIKCWKDFRQIPVSSEHPIEVLRDGNFIFIQAEELSLNDYIRITWPSEIEDINKFSLIFTDKYKKIESGYELNFKVPHPRSPLTINVRKKFISWLGSLSQPIIKTREQLSKDLDIPLQTLNNIIFKLGNELDQKFHKRLGALKWQGGSQVEWLPIDISCIEVTDSYTIHKTKFLKAIDEININDDFAYLAGYWLGDGTLARDSNRSTWGRGLWQIVFDETKINNIDKITTILKNIFGEEAITQWSSNKLKYIKIISNPAFIEWWAENFGETSFGKNYKKIPEWFIKLPEKKLLNFLAGLIDSDGCVSVSGEKRNCIVQIAMASRSLMDAIKDITMKCDIITSYGCGKERKVILPDKNSTMSRKMYTLTASDEDSCRLLTQFSNKKIPEDAYFSEIKKYWIKTDNGIAFKIRNMTTENYNDLVYNFEVEEDHTYQVAGFSTHNCFIFCEENDWEENLSPEEVATEKERALNQRKMLETKYQVKDKNPLFKGWKKLLILPPDQVRVRKLPLSDETVVDYMPDPETRRFLTSDLPIDPMDPAKKYDIPQDLRDKVRQNGMIPLDTNPYTGSHVYHLARKKSQYEPLGVSIIERCINTLVLMDKLRQAQTSIASRHMTPMRIVWSEGLSDSDVDNLREQVDMALVDPDYSVIANYEIHWEEMGSSGRLLDVETEMESSLNRLLAGLGITREILTGEGTYTGGRISLEIMNTEYLLFREIIQDYVENFLFKPIAKKKGFVEYDDYGNEVLLYPRLSFTRLAIRDNEQYFDAAFQLYQKGSISIDLILDILNIDPDSTKEKLEKDLFTVNDSIFNELIRNLYTNISTVLSDKTNLAEKLAEYLKLELVPEATPTEGESRFSSVDADHRKKLSKIISHLLKNPGKIDAIFPTKKE